MYQEFGYDMPVFYISDNPELVGRILSGEIPSKFKDDLVELTKQPLVIRTDGVNIPNEKREMLPRSEELRSYDQAKDWLLK